MLTRPCLYFFAMVLMLRTLAVEGCSCVPLTPRRICSLSNMLVGNITGEVRLEFEREYRVHVLDVIRSDSGISVGETMTIKTPDLETLCGAFLQVGDVYILAPYHADGFYIDLCAFIRRHNNVLQPYNLPKCNAYRYNDIAVRPLGDRRRDESYWNSQQTPWSGLLGPSFDFASVEKKAAPLDNTLESELRQHVLHQLNVPLEAENIEKKNTGPKTDSSMWFDTMALMTGHKNMARKSTDNSDIMQKDTNHLRQLFGDLFNVPLEADQFEKKDTGPKTDRNVWYNLMSSLTDHINMAKKATVDSDVAQTEIPDSIQGLHDLFIEALGAASVEKKDASPVTDRKISFHPIALPADHMDMEKKSTHNNDVTNKVELISKKDTHATGNIQDSAGTRLQDLAKYLNDYIGDQITEK